MYRPFIAAVLCLSVTACAPMPSIRLVGSRADIEGLTGEWSGSYESRDTGREGSIWFNLSAGEEHAQGDVVMTPRGRGASYGRGSTDASPRGDKLLTIRFVAVGDGRVEGVLDSYWDPDCQCQAYTSFRGRLSGDRITGEFVTQFMTGPLAKGRWSVNRRRHRTG